MIASVLTTFSCKKGDPGPQGLPGTNGKDGNANVQSFSFTTSAWILVGSYWYYDYNLPSGTNMNGGVFMYLQSGTTYAALPLTVNDEEYLYSYDTSAGQVEADVQSASGSTAISNPGFLGFKIVIIPPAQRLANPNVNYKNYEEVKAAFNLKD